MIVALILTQAAMPAPGPVAAQSAYQRCLVAKARPMVAAGKDVGTAVTDADADCQVEYAVLKTAIAAAPGDPLLSAMRPGPGGRLQSARQDARKAAIRALRR